MSKGFLSFADDGRGLTMLKEEPDDLSHHLASTACIQLDEMTPFSDMLVGLMSSCLLPDEINSLDSTTCSTTTSVAPHYQSSSHSGSQSSSYASSPLSPLTPTGVATTAGSNGSHSSSTPSIHSNNQHHDNSNSSSSNIDPLFNYREESNDTSCSQHLHSPSITSKSPEDSSLPSLCSPSSLTQEDDFSFVDFEMRAPYIPMGDDMPLLTETDLMWCPPEDMHGSMPKEIDAIQQQLQQLQQQQHHHQQQQAYSQYNQQQQQQQQQHQQQQQQQQHFSNSLCSSPASTVSSLSPSPVQQQQQQQHAGGVFTTDSSELAALLCGTGNGTLSILEGSGGSAAEECSERLQQQQQQATSDFRSFQQLQQELQLQEEQQQQDQQRQHQQQQQQMISLSIECKKEKYEVPMAPSLTHSIEDAFENDYSKDSSNLDCWDLLQMNVAEAAVSPAASPSPCKVTTIQLLQHQQQQLQQQQNIILNAVPLITIQNNKSILHQQQQQEQLQELMLTAKQQAPAATMKLLNGASIAPVTTKATIRLVESKPQQTTTQQQQQRLGKAAMLQTLVPQQQQHGNKRHLNSQASQGNQVESKRLKSGTLCLDVQSPQLLQQLIGKDSAQQQTLAAKRAAGERWQQTAEGKQQQKLQQQSNSVLKNLLVSGRDVNEPEDVSEPMIIDDNCLDQTGPKLAPMGCYGKYGLPLHCHTSTSAVLRNYHHNPLISGTNFQLSPVFSGSDAGGGDGDAGSVVSLDDSVPPGLTACDTDASSDSGIDENSLVEGASASPRKRVLISNSETGTGLGETASPPLDVVPQQQQVGEEEAEGCPNGSSAPSRKTSISFLDNSNPLLHTPAMMDLCNDDYIMSEGGFEFSESQLEQVLGWSEIA